MAYTRKKDNVNAINYAIRMNRTNNMTGDRDESLNGVVLAEDLSNLVDAGTYVANLDADQLKSFAKDLAMGIARIEFIDRVYTADTFGIVKENVDYNGALERICTKALAKILPSSANNLVSGINYFDGKYYGPELSAVVWSDENANFKIPYSVGYEDIKAKFTDERWVMTTIDSWRNMIKTSLEVYLKGIADTLINRMIVECNTNNKVVNLVSGFGDYFGYYSGDGDERTYTYNWNDIKSNDDLSKQFVAYWCLVLNIVKDGFTKLQSKYNDGTVPTFTPSNKIRLIGLTEFVNDMTYLGRANIFNENIIPRDNMSTTLSWQCDGAGMLPTIDVTGTISNGTITVSGGEVTAQNKTDTSGVVGVMYDEDMIGVTSTLNKIGVEEVGAELFNTYFHHFAIRQYLDKRGNAIIFKIDDVTTTS